MNMTQYKRKHLFAFYKDHYDIIKKEQVVSYYENNKPLYYGYIHKGRIKRFTKNGISAYLTKFYEWNNTKNLLITERK